MSQTSNHAAPSRELSFASGMDGDLQDRDELALLQRSTFAPIEAFRLIFR